MDVCSACLRARDYNCGAMPYRCSDCYLEAIGQRAKLSLFAEIDRRLGRLFARVGGPTQSIQAAILATWWPVPWPVPSKYTMRQQRGQHEATPPVCRSTIRGLHCERRTLHQQPHQVTITWAREGGEL